MTDRIFPLIPGSKRPAIGGWNEIQKGVYQPVGCYGIALDPEVLVLDVDPRNFPLGRNTIQELFSSFPCPPTKVVKTPSGGYHYYFINPTGKRVKKKQAAYPGIDFLSYGSFVVGPGSWTDAGTYELVQDTAPATIPADLLGALDEYGERKEGTDVYSLDGYQHFVSLCQVSDPAVKGASGDDTTYRLACRGRDFGLSAQLVAKTMREHYNPRCVPPWEITELQDKVEHAFQYARNSAGCDLPTAGFQPPAQTEPDTRTYQDIQEWQINRQREILEKPNFDTDKSGKPLLSLHNVSLFLRGDPQWRGMLKYNMFSLQIEWSTLPWWRKEQRNLTVALTDNDRYRLLHWFSSRMQWRVPDNMLEAAVVTAAYAYHPVQDYLDGLVWDGKPRLDRMLIDTTGAKDSDYTRGVSKNVMIAAVKRIYEPGCKQDYVLILESRQGKNKSKWVETLGDPWYSANELKEGDKDTYQCLRGRWIVELPEIDKDFTDSQMAWIKAMVSRSTDVYRASYGRYASEVPRESVFIGTINPKANGRYLSDDENRRFWPVKTGQFDIEKLRRFKNQYFAEAVHRYKQGEQHWFEDESLACDEQLERREVDPWSEILSGWISANAQSGFSTAEVTAALGITPAQFRRSHQDRLYRTLHDANMEYDRGTHRWTLKEDWRGRL